MNIYLFDFLTVDLVNKLYIQILETKDTTINVYINCPGGSDEVDYCLYDLLFHSNKKIITYNLGEVSSAAITVYLAGNERYCLPSGKFMIHEAWAESDKEEIKSKDYKKSLKDLEEVNEKYFNFIADRTKLTKLKIKNNIKKSPEGDWWFSAEEAKKLGIVTKIIER